VNKVDLYTRTLNAQNYRESKDFKNFFKFFKIYKRLSLFYCFPVVAEKEEMSRVRIGELEKFYKNRK